MTKLVLLVEDHEDNLIVYRTILEHGGYRVTEARDGLSALQAVRSDRPDLVLLDISIPEPDGWEVARRLKGDPATAGIPIVVVTAHAMESDRRMAEDLECDGYIPKPAPPQQILEEVRSCIGVPAA